MMRDLDELAEALDDIKDAYYRGGIESPTAYHQSAEEDFTAISELITLAKALTAEHEAVTPFIDHGFDEGLFEEMWSRVREDTVPAGMYAEYRAAFATLQAAHDNAKEAMER